MKSVDNDYCDYSTILFLFLLNSFSQTRVVVKCLEVFQEAM